MLREQCGGFQKMRSVLIGVALFGAVPALASEFPPEISSFAYPAGHPASAAPFDDIALPTQHIPPQPESTAASAPTAPVGPQLPSKRELCSTVAFEAANNNLPVRFFANLIQQESNFNPNVVSHKGAQGIAQFMPMTAAERGLSDPFEPIQALGASARFLADLLGRFGNLGLAAAAYNAGPQRVSDWLARQGSGLPAETQHYVRRITGIAVEQWARPDPKGEDIRLPPHADCPQFRTASADSLVNTRIAATEAETSRRSVRRLYDKYAKFRGSALTYVSLSPSIAKSAPNEFTKGVSAKTRSRMRLASGAS